MKAQLRTTPASRPKKDWSPVKEFLPIILGKEVGEELDAEELSKLELFEKGLASQLDPNDSIEQSVTKIVKMALAAEYGPSLVAAKGANGMVASITNLIMSEAQLRKQALIIIDRFADA